jgi:hypothetical protein
MFSYLLSLFINTEEQDKIVKSAEAASSIPVKPLLDEPGLTWTIRNLYKYLYSVSCVGGDQIWTRRNDKAIKLFNLQGKLLASIQTKSGVWAGT